MINLSVRGPLHADCWLAEAWGFEKRGVAGGGVNCAPVTVPIQSSIDAQNRACNGVYACACMAYVHRNASVPDKLWLPKYVLSFGQVCVEVPVNDGLCGHFRSIRTVVEAGHESALGPSQLRLC
jgi:hypothetical protein